VSTRTSEAQSATNVAGDLSGVNEGEFILLQWDDVADAAYYHLYKAASALGPWRLEAGLANNLGGAKVDYTLDGLLTTVCYKVAATNKSNLVIRLYEPICLGPYVPSAGA
jgi:hypothetical protein